MDGDNRLYRIIKIIEQNNITTLQSIADKLEVSTKTIKNEIKELNKVLKGCALIDIKQQKYELYIINEEYYEDVKESLYNQNSFLNSQQNRMAHIFYTLINSNTHYLTDDLIEELSVGRTSFISDLKQLRERVKSYNIEIIGKTSKGLSIVGNELDIRLFIINDMYLSIYNGFEIDKSILGLVNAAYKTNFFSDETLDYFMKFLTVSIDRISRGYRISNLDKSYINLKGTSTYLFINQILNNIGNTLDIEFTEEEKIFMILPLVSMRTPINLQNSTNIDISNDAVRIVDDIIKLIKTQLNINIIPGDFLNEFIYHIYFMMNRVKFGIKVSNPILEDIKEKYSLAYKMAEIASDLVERKLERKVSKDEIGYMAMYFGLFLSENLYTTEKIYKVAVVCSTGVLTARIIASQLKKVLSSETIIDIYASNEITESLLNQYNLVFSTFKMQLSTYIPIIYVKEIFDESDFRKKIEYIKFTKNLDIPLMRGIDSIILSILEEENFFVLDSNKSYDENIDIMLKSLLENDYIDDGFKNRLKIREENSTMVFDKSIAIPHVINYKSNKVVFALGVFDEGLKVKEGRDVRLVFLLGIPEERGHNEKLIVRIYNEIISIAKDYNKVNEIAKIKKYNDFIQYMIKENNTF